MPIVLQAAVHELPQPLHLFAALFDGNHYHFGLFARPQQPFDEAQDALAQAVVARVEPGARVLDVGCGLGGTTRVLARRGHVTVGIDPCGAAIGFARTSAGADGRASFAAAGFERYCDEGGATPFDALVLVEVLQHLPPLQWTLPRACALLRPGGTLVVADVVKRTPLPWERVPFHPAGSLSRLARAAGLEDVEQLDLAERVAATPARLAEALNAARSALRERFPDRGALDHEIDEVLRQCALLDEAFGNGDLGYELVVLRRPARA